MDKRIEAIIALMQQARIALQAEVSSLDSAREYDEATTFCSFCPGMNDPDGCCRNQPNWSPFNEWENEYAEEMHKTLAQLIALITHFEELNTL